MEKLLSIPDLFKKSFEIYKPRIWTMVLLGLVSWVSSIVIFAIFGAAGFITFVIGKNALPFNLLTTLVVLVGTLLAIIVSLWVNVALIYAVKEENAKSSAKDLLMMVRSRMVSYYWVAFLNALVVLAGFILFIIPGIIFSVWFCFSQYAFVFEGSTGGKALGRSRDLVKGYWWPVLGRILILAAISILISFISRLGFLINSLFTVPFGIVYMYTIYQDLKRVKSV